MDDHIWDAVGLVVVILLVMAVCIVGLVVWVMCEGIWI